MNYRKKAMLLIVALCSLNLSIRAQALSLNIQNVTVKKAMTELQAQSGYSFVYITDDLDTGKKVSVNATQIEDAIKQILTGQQVSYEIQGKNIIIKKIPSEQKSVQQKQAVSGTVNDANGDPIIGANVTMKGESSIGTVTDINGKFVLDIPSNAVLLISYIGFTPQEIEVANQKELHVVLQEDAEILNEVVVIGYGTSRKKDITGSIASIKAAELNVISSSNVSQMLQGKVTGMSAVQNSAQPGAGMSINIRGAASPNGSNAPLYVVDGVPLQTNTTADPGLTSDAYEYRAGVDRDPLNTLNPSDIESIEVLKDASAAAIYGASAANGVVLITTKSGKSGKPKVEYRCTFTGQLPKDYPEVMGAKDFREQANLWTKEYYLYSQKMGVYGDNPIDLSGYTAPFADVNGYVVDTDWMDEVRRKGFITDQNVSVNGGAEKTKYYFSYNFYDNKGMLKQSDLKRHSIRLNLDQEFTKIFKAGIKFNYSNVKANSTSVGAAGNGDNMLQNALRFAPDIPVRDEEGNYSRSYNQLYNNPVAFTEIEDITTTQRIFIAPTLEIKLFDGLSLRGIGGYDQQFTTREFYLPRVAMNTTVPEGEAQLGSAKVINLSAEAFLSYNNVFNEIHHVSAILGVGYYRTRDNGFGLAAYNFFTDAFGYNNVGIASDKEQQSVRSWKNERTKLSQFVRLNYSLMDRYIFTFTARRDGSSYFAENNKWGIFPSFSVAWRINEEAFLTDARALSDLKLRVGYGSVGNENVLGTNSMSLYRSGYNYLYGNTMHTGLALTQIENPNLKWETNYTLNVGIDYGFLNQRINGSIEYFHRAVKDLLDYQRLPSNNAVGRVAANIGETQSQGFEFSLFSDNLKSKRLKWETSFNLSYFKTNWVKRNPEVALAEYIGEKDELDAIYGWKTDGIITSKEDIPTYMPDAQMGNIKYIDVNGDNVLDSKDVVKLGNSTPRWYVGFGNTFRFKGFDLNIYFYGAFGYKKYRGQVPDAARIGNAGTAVSNTYKTIMTDVWNSQTGTGWMPGIATNSYDSSNPAGNNDFHLMNGAYVKLKNITLGYTLPRKVFTNSKFIKDARFFVDLQNVATFTGYEGFDPELGTDNPYPQALSLSLGFNLNF